MTFEILILKTHTLTKRTYLFSGRSVPRLLYVHCATGPTCARIKPRAKPATEGRFTYSLLLVFEVSPELLQISRNGIPGQLQSLNDIPSIPGLVLSNERVCVPLVKVNSRDNEEKSLKTLYLYIY